MYICLSCNFLIYIILWLLLDDYTVDLSATLTLLLS